mgnify:CR=1 FL=1
MKIKVEMEVDRKGDVEGMATGAAYVRPVFSKKVEELMCGI